MEPVVQCVDLWKIYHTGKVEVPALRGVNLEVREGEFVGYSTPSARIMSRQCVVMKLWIEVVPVFSPPMCR